MIESKAYRWNDPDTSRQSFNGKDLQKLALETIAAYPNITAGELGDLTGRNGIWKRLPEMAVCPECKGIVHWDRKHNQENHFLERGEPAVYEGTGRHQTTWTVTELGLKKLREEWPNEYDRFPRYHLNAEQQLSLFNE